MTKVASISSGTLLFTAALTATSIISPAYAASDCETPDGRRAFTLEEQDQATYPSIPDARFFGDDEKAFLNAVPKQPGPWLVMSGGGADGAYAAGILNGWSERDDRPQFSVVTGASTGALIAPFAFLGKDYDQHLRESYTTINAGDVFEDAATPQSLLDTWPLKDTIAKQVTPELLEAIAKEYDKGRRLFVTTVSLDSERTTVWNMGAIAKHGGEDGLALFRNVLLASSSVPGLFPPVTFDFEANGHCVREVHLDGSVGGPFYLAPDGWMDGSSFMHLPSEGVYLILNSQIVRHFEMTQPNTLSVLGRAIGIALKTTGRADVERVFQSAQRDAIPINFAHIGGDFAQLSQGAFDDVYMKALFERGETEARKGRAFRQNPPSFDAAPQDAEVR
jgi:hypothetical protein